MQSMIKKRTKGFTLLELIIVIAIAGILFAYGLPSYRLFSARQTLTNETNNLIGDINYAKLTAINTGASVLITSNNGNNWSDGWVITFPATGELLREKQAVAGNISLTANRDSLLFLSIGNLRTVTGAFNMTVEKTPEYPNYLTLNVALSGMVSSNKRL